MARTLPNMPLCPRAGRSGRSAAAARSSIVGTAGGAVAPAAAASSCRPKPSGRRSGIGLPRGRHRSQALHPGEDPALAIVEALLDVGWEEESPARRPDAERDRDGVLRLMADRDRDPLHAQLLRAPRGAAVEAHGRSAVRQAFDLELRPA